MRVKLAELPVLVDLHRHIDAASYFHEVVIVAGTRIVTPAVDGEAALLQLVFLCATARECCDGNASRQCRTYQFDTCLLYTHTYITAVFFIFIKQK